MKYNALAYEIATEISSWILGRQEVTYIHRKCQRIENEYVRTYLYSIQSHKTTPWSVTALAVRTVGTRPIQATVLNELTRDSTELHSLQMQFKLTCVWTYRIRHSVTGWWNSNCLLRRPANECDFHEHDIIILVVLPWPAICKYPASNYVQGHPSGIDRVLDLPKTPLPHHRAMSSRRPSALTKPEGLTGLRPAVQ